MMGAHGVVACDGGGKEFWEQGLDGLERAPGREALGSGDAEAGRHARGRSAALGWRSPTQRCPGPTNRKLWAERDPVASHGQYHYMVRRPRVIPPPPDLAGALPRISLLHGEGATGNTTAA